MTTLIRTSSDGSAFSLVDLLSATYGWNKNISAHRVKRFLARNEFDRSRIFKCKLKSRGVSRDGTWVCNDRGFALEVCRQIKEGVGEPRGKYKKRSRTAGQLLPAPAAVPDTTLLPLTIPAATDDVAFTLDSPAESVEEIQEDTIQHINEWENFLL